MWTKRFENSLILIFYQQSKFDICIMFNIVKNKFLNSNFWLLKDEMIKYLNHILLRAGNLRDYRWTKHPSFLFYISQHKYCYLQNCLTPFIILGLKLALRYFDLSIRLHYNLESRIYNFKYLTKIKVIPWSVKAENDEWCVC